MEATGVLEATPVKANSALLVAFDPKSRSLLCAKGDSAPDPNCQKLIAETLVQERALVPFMVNICPLVPAARVFMAEPPDPYSRAPAAGATDSPVPPYVVDKAAVPDKSPLALKTTPEERPDRVYEEVALLNRMFPVVPPPRVRVLFSKDWMEELFAESTSP